MSAWAAWENRITGERVEVPDGKTGTQVLVTLPRPRDWFFVRYDNERTLVEMEMQDSDLALRNYRQRQRVARMEAESFRYHTQGSGGGRPWPDKFRS